MKLVYSFEYRGKHRSKLLDWCHTSKNLYNQALYLVKKELKENNKWVSYPELDKRMKEVKNLDKEINYRLLKATVSQQCLRHLSTDISSYVKAIKKWSKNKDAFNGMPRMPHYKRNYNVVELTYGGCSIRNGYLNLDKETHIKIPQWNKYKDYISDFNQVRIIPDNGHVKIEIIYEKKELETKKGKKKHAAIDLGVNNLMTVTIEGEGAWIYSGRQIKTINRRCSKKIGKLQSLLQENKNKDEDKKQKYTSKRIKEINRNRRNEINDLEHKSTRHLVNLLMENDVTHLIVGRNKGWKQKTKLNKHAAQMFEFTSFYKLLNKLHYKCKLCGIEVIEHEESYTSKCDALALEPICKHETYKGSRVKRGMFQSSIGTLINADVNGSLNIMRNVAGDECLHDTPAVRGFWSNPVLYHNLNKL